MLELELYKLNMECNVHLGSHKSQLIGGPVGYMLNTNKKRVETGGIPSPFHHHNEYDDE